MSTRIAFITNLCPPYRRPLFERLASRFDIDFYFFSEGEDRFLSKEMSSQEGAFHVERIRRLSLAGHPLLPGLATRLARQRYDAVVKCLNGRLMVPYVYSLAKMRGLPLILWTGMWYHPRTRAHRATKPLTEHIYRGADSIVAYGDHVKRALSEVGGVEPRKIYVAGQAVEMDRLRAIPTGHRAKVVLYVGQLEERKGIGDLLAAFDSLDDPSARLRIVGSGPLRPKIEAASASDRRIELTGHLPPDELPDELERARCLVLPSVTTHYDREPWGLVVNEALAASVPVVVTDAVGAAAGGLVRHERNGFVVPERDRGALAGALRHLVSDQELAAALGAQGREDAGSFTYERMADAFTAAISHADERRTTSRTSGHDS